MKSNTQPHSILVVDDAKAVRDLAKQALAPLGAAVAESTNGYNALFAMEKSLPDLIVFDVKMPVMDGLELLTMMRSTPALARLPVVMLTSPADHRILPQLTELGVSAILTKPLRARRPACRRAAGAAAKILSRSRQEVGVGVPTDARSNTAEPRMDPKKHEWHPAFPATPPLSELSEQR